jgi:prevent-host-death family protein
MSVTVSPDGPHEHTVGVRELRERAASLLQEVARGRVVTVTRSGHPVARLVPVSTPGDHLEELVVTGAATRAEDTGDLLDVMAVPPTTGHLPSAALTRMRDEERW